MKNALLFILASSFLAIGFAQDCNSFVPTKKGAEWEITNYSGKGKMEGKTSYIMKDVVTAGTSITYLISTTSYDKKGKEIMSNELEAYCKNGTFEFDMSFFFNEEMMGGMGEMDVDMEMEMSSLQMPSFTDPVGTELPEGNILIKMEMPGMGEMKMEFLYTNRKIESKESLSVPAGTFDCVVLSQDLKMKTIMEITTKSKDWYAEGVGMVRNEVYNGKKLMSYSELTMIK